MKYIRKFKESSSIPLYTKGEILVFVNRGVKEDTISDIAKQLGAELDVRMEYPDYYLIKTPIGKEEVIGQDFVDNYPEFFNSYERRDINLERMMDEIDEITSDVESIHDYIGGTKKYFKKGFNEYIDSIIKRLEKIKN